MLNFAGLLLTVSAFMQLPALGASTLWNDLKDAMGWGFLAFAVGMVLPGPFVSFLVEKYRRNVVCIRAVIVYMAAFAAICALNRIIPELRTPAFIALRMVEGGAYAFAQMVLVSTLVTDCSEAGQRTTANYAVAWFQRLAIALGPAAGLLMAQWLGGKVISMGVLVAAFISIVLIRLVNFPFRAPEITAFHLSRDRFFLVAGQRLFLHVVILGVCMGLLAVALFSFSFFSLLMVGFLLAMGGEVMLGKVEKNATKLVVGMGLLILAFLAAAVALPWMPKYIAPLLAGCGVGLAAARLQISYIHVSQHCQRGTSQSSFWLSWEMGNAVGMAFALAVSELDGMQQSWQGWCLGAGLVLAVASLAWFVCSTHNWYRAHIKR